MKQIGLVFFLLFLVFFASLSPVIGKEAKKFPFFIKENEKRYQIYQKENPNLSLKQVILHVNIGLDFPFYTHTRKSSFLNTSYVLVNKYYFLPETYVPKQLEVLEKTDAREGLSLVKEAKEAFSKLVSKAQEDGNKIRAISAYRSYSYQKKLYNHYSLQDGKALADTYSARPGFSEHQTGLCVDVDDGVENYENFAKTKSFQWMMKNAYQYGFILRYPEGKEKITGYGYEAWHYRYVGVEIATFLQKNKITLDEYYMEFLKQKEKR